MNSLNTRRRSILLAAIGAVAVTSSVRAQDVTFSSLLSEMSDADSLARLPAPAFRQMQASSYNRESTKRGEPGWFADSDGTGFIREETIGGRHEFVAMEHAGPGCITRMWAPFFYYDFNDRVGPSVRIYLDGSETPTIEASWIELLTNNEWPDSFGRPPERKNTFRIPSPLARFTARAGDVYLPIPFARSCKVTFDKRPFYNIINWRAYDEGTRVETFTREMMETQREAIEECGKMLVAPPAVPKVGTLVARGNGPSMVWTHKSGPGAIRGLEISLDPAALRKDPGLLRSIILRMEFDGEQTVWCPLGDFFGSPNTINNFSTTYRSSREGVFTCNWTMPFHDSASITAEQPPTSNLMLQIAAHKDEWSWDERSMYFHAVWRPDELRAGDRFADINFADIRGRGVLVGDQWSVLNPTHGWWGEGDEKIYVDASYERGFPDHFGTGTEDYYGWAGGVVPNNNDVFSHPFLANIAVGSWSRGMAPGGASGGAGSTRGFNICSRTRGLDAIPFTSRLVFDMEASPGVDQRNASDFLGYSSVVFYYARPGSTCNLAPDPEAAKKRIMSLEDIEKAAGAVKK
ncbi:MAG: glycoside hydrolase family 172 protein [Phycisphaerales bacterium]